MEDGFMLVSSTDFSDGKEAGKEAIIEDSAVVGQGETVATAEIQPVVDLRNGKFTWTIERFSKVKATMQYSDSFVVGGCKWRLLLHPKGNIALKSGDHLSVYLDVEDSKTLPKGWSISAQLSLSVINQFAPRATVKKNTQHLFNRFDSDWGFTKFMPLKDLHDPSRGFLVNDTLVVEAEVNVSEDKDVPLQKEQEKQKAEAHLYTIIKVTRDDDLEKQIGKDLYFDLVDHDKEEVAKELGIPVICQRFWLWAKRKNHTCRPHRPLTEQEETQPVGDLPINNAELKLFLEVPAPFLERRLPFVPHKKTENDILLFFKLYDPEKEELRYVGKTFVKALGKPSDILNRLNEMAVFAPTEEINLYEEILFEPNIWCEPIDKTSTFSANKLQDGDILCYQKKLTEEEELAYRYSDVPSFLEHVCNRQVVHFRHLEKLEEDEFCLELSKQDTYDQVALRIAQQLGLEDPSKIRLTSQNCYSLKPKPQPISYSGVNCLRDMLVHDNQTSDLLYFETLDIPLPELHGLKTLEVALCNAETEEVSVHKIQFSKQSRVGDVREELKRKVDVSLRILDLFDQKFYKSFPANEKIENIDDQYWTLQGILQAEAMAEEKDGEKEE